MSKRTKKRQSRRKPVSAQPSVETKKDESRKSISYGREFNPDYSSTIKDLKRIGTLAGTFFVILIALAFLLR